MSGVTARPAHRTYSDAMDVSASIAVIGGTGFYSFFDSDAREVNPQTPFGSTSAPISIGSVGGVDVAFLPRHGRQHEYLPHSVPYRANMYALRSIGVQRVYAPCAVGSLQVNTGPGTIVVPDQLVDRTSGRVQTFFDSGAVHVSFADPYCPQMRQIAITSGDGVVGGGTMVVVEGPRFSTRAESQWYAGLGWSLVNMTGHPEAVLARELKICYAPIALVTDLDAGIAEGEGVTSSEVFEVFGATIGQLTSMLATALPEAARAPACSCADGEHDLHELLGL
ncbi:S-methyl-5'-thioadenosine phosphorylase [Gordonia jinhuaensis]|uniref:Purine nucleoside phosphorylase n=2 Tax=Gordonia jinhuaensis TaxID=1517702 RepID=A0A916X032_9ACTN|nr:S-methyl-5'-thioadenosine phosphorylase [Gordonia jinhuaensis]